MHDAAIPRQSFHPDAVFGLGRAIALLAFALACLVVGLLGGRNWLVIALAVFPLFYLLRRPKEALWCALAFVPVAASLDPEVHRWFDDTTATQMYYWAAGLFIVVLPVGLEVVRRLFPFGWNRLKRAGIPVSLLFFFAVSLAACLQGIRFGSPVTFVIRQFYGVLLLCLGFAAVQLFHPRPFELRQALRRVRWLVLALCVYTIVFYLSDQGEVGFFKGNMSVFSVTLAIYSVGEFLCARGLLSRIAWGVWALLFLLHPILFSSRGALGLAAIAILAGIGLKTRSRAARYAMLAAALSFLSASVAFDLFAGLGRFLERYELLDRLIPENILLDPDALARIDQLLAAVSAVREHPLLGLGFGSTLTWYQPALDVFESHAFVDSGYAYLLSKMGLLGALSFAWFAFTVLKRLPRQNGLELGLWLVVLFQLLYMMVGGIVVHFFYATWAGVIWGLLYQSRLTALSAGHEAPLPGGTVIGSTA